MTDMELWVRQGQPRFASAARFTLDQVVEAHQTVERGAKIGHVILTIV